MLEWYSILSSTKTSLIRFVGINQSILTTFQISFRFICCYCFSYSMYCKFWCLSFPAMHWINLDLNPPPPPINAGKKMIYWKGRMLSSLIQTTSFPSKLSSMLWKENDKSIKHKIIYVIFRTVLFLLHLCVLNPTFGRSMVWPSPGVNPLWNGS